MNRKKTWARLCASLVVLGVILLGAAYAADGHDVIKSDIAEMTATFARNEVGALRILSASAHVLAEKSNGDAVEGTYFMGEQEGVGSR